MYTTDKLWQCNRMCLVVNYMHLLVPEIHERKGALTPLVLRVVAEAEIAGIDEKLAVR